MKILYALILTLSLFIGSAVNAKVYPPDNVIIIKAVPVPASTNNQDLVHLIVRDNRTYEVYVIVVSENGVRKVIKTGMKQY